PTYSYADTRGSPPVGKVAPSVKALGDPARGEKVWKNSACINCHVVPDDGRWAGNVGPSLAMYGAGLDPRLALQNIYDPRGVGRGRWEGEWWGGGRGVCGRGRGGRTPPPICRP